MAKDTKTIQIKSQFDDFEVFTQIIQGWGLDFRQMDCGLFKADLHQIITPEILISDFSFNRCLIQLGEQPPGMRTFAIMTEDATPFIWRKQEVTKNSFIIFPTGAELDVTSLAGFHVYTLSVSNQVIEARLQRGDDYFTAVQLRQGGVLKVLPTKIKALRSYLRQVTAEVIQWPELVSQQTFQQRLCDDLTEYIFDILSLGETSSLTLSFSKRARLIKGIETWVAETDHEVRSVHDLCRTFQVNERTLRRIFTEWYGVSPHQYLMAVRLNGVRKELCRACRHTNRITDIANHWGFWHMGKFAMIYRRQFGELPSETLKNQSQPNHLHSSVPLAVLATENSSGKV